MNWPEPARRAWPVAAVPATLQESAMNQEQKVIRAKVGILGLARTDRGTEYCGNPEHHE